MFIFSVSGDMGWFWAWKGRPVLEPFWVFVYRVVRLMTRLGNTLEISSNPMGPVMLCYLESLNSSIDSLQSVRVVREYPDILGGVKGLPLDVG